MFTLGDKYDISILNLEPMAPSIDQPACNPKPKLTLKFGISLNNLAFLLYIVIFLSTVILDMILRKLINADSAIKVLY